MPKVKGVIHAIRGFDTRRALACALVACAPGLGWAFAGTISVPEYQAVSEIAGQVIRNAQASSRFINGVRTVAATVQVAGAARSMPSNAVTVAVIGTAALSALAAYCYNNGAACTVDSSDLKNYLTLGAQYFYDAIEGWKKPADAVDGTAYKFSQGGVTYMPYYSASDACAAWAQAKKTDLKKYNVIVLASYYGPNNVGVTTAKCDLRYYDTATYYYDSKGVTTTPYAAKVPAGFVPATLQDIASFINAKPAADLDQALNDWPEPLPIPVSAPVVKPSTIALGKPYPGPDPKTGYRQDYARVEPAPAPQTYPSVVVSTGTAVVDNPATPETEGPPTVDTPDPTTGEQIDPATSETKDPGLCDLYPDILACAKIGTAPADQVPKRVVTVGFSEETPGLPAYCPADKPLPHGQVIAYVGICDTAVAVKPFVLALAYLSAALMVIAVIRRS